jgi:succinate dehydrogenase flavin-adding protein (antitoxin of CptAB toxin-antitoxin module)
MDTKKVETISEYNSLLQGEDKQICQLLQKQIEQNLPKVEGKIWHRHAVWFIEGNPVVGYSKLKDCVQLLFWSGQSFDEGGLMPEGTFKAAQARYTSLDQINTTDLKRWLTKAEAIQWDYKNIVKRKGNLERIK